MSKRQMVMNYVPGEECRVAIVEDGKLDDFHAERMDGPSSHVGNIYVGKVVNVEPAIQAAFIDFGLEANGFLHVSDVHPQYFPGEDNEKTERVGKKTPRRERPPIQDCFRRGDEVAVQVLKEGVGTKGPTVTSYLSIPGRFLVMMPQMDKVGVSRKVEDEETRRKMREILDQLDLPEGFGFILRTAGMERTKAELKRDLAYLMRLWKDMEKRWRTGNKPRLLYSESDLLVRALRDLLTGEIDQIVVDNESALNRAARFLKIVSPRTTTRLVHYTGKTPIFHAMGVEPQIQMIHAREVPLSSGGRLVIDEAEALVAIDVNSGKSRDARDSETNAIRTNEEAADEICRQIKLRDLGGVIVCDFIDMRSGKHRRDIENRMRDNLKKDRARWTTAPISEFGILELTRQRMRASHESQHFTDCPTCRGRGLVQRPDSVTSDALRELAAIVDSDQVSRAEMVVSPRLAGELLSTCRKALSRLERSSGKHVDVRVSEAIPMDRVTFYAYDDRGADLDVSKLGQRKVRDSEMVTYEITADAAEMENWADIETPIEAPEPEEVVEEIDLDPHPIELEPASLQDMSDRPRRDVGPHGQGDEQGDERGGRRRRRRRRGRGGRGRGGEMGGPDHGPAHGPEHVHAEGAYVEGDPGHAMNPEDHEPLSADPAHATGEGSHHHDHPHDHRGSMNGTAPHGQNGQFGEPGEGGEGGPRKRRRRRRGRGGRGGQGHGAPGHPQHGQHDPIGGPQGEYAPETSDEGAEYAQEYAGEPQGELAHEYAPSDEVAPYSSDESAMPGESGEFAGGDQNTDGPHQPAHPDHDQGEGQGPRRRRRRRGGRGRGGRDSVAPEQGPVPPQARPQGRRPGTKTPPADSLAAMFRSESFVEPSENDAPVYDDGPSDPVEAHEAEPIENAPASEPQGDAPPPSDGPDGGGRRRGGRRRGRGGRGGSGNNPAEGRPQGRSQEPGMNARPNSSSQPQRPSSPPPAPKAQDKGEAKPKPRTLYSSRRKLAPGDLKNLKRED